MTTPLQQWANLWSKRASQVQSLGISQDTLTPVARYDLQRVQQGSSPMTNEEATLGLLAAQRQAPVIQPPHPQDRPCRDVGECRQGPA